MPTLFSEASVSQLGRVTILAKDHNRTYGPGAAYFQEACFRPRIARLLLPTRS